MVYHLLNQMVRLYFPEAGEGGGSGSKVQRWSLGFPLSLSMINGTLFALKGLLEEKDLENDFTTIHCLGCLSENHPGYAQQELSSCRCFLEEMGEFTPGQVEKVNRKGWHPYPGNSPSAVFRAKKDEFGELTLLAEPSGSSEGQG